MRADIYYGLFMGKTKGSSYATSIAEFLDTPQRSFNRLFACDVTDTILAFSFLLHIMCMLMTKLFS